MKKHTYLLILAILVHWGCGDDRGLFEYLDAENGPFVTFVENDLNFRIDIFDPQSAVFEATLHDNGNATERYMLHVTHTNENAETVTFENFKTIENFPHKLQINFTELTDALNLDPENIGAGEVFNFHSTALGKDGVTYESNTWIFDEGELLKELDENEDVIRIHDPGTARQGGDYDSSFERLSYKSAMLFDLSTFISPPPIYRYTSFETVPVPASEDRYCKNEGPDHDEDLVNNEGEPHVDHVATGTGPEDEIGFNSEFFSNDQGGFSCEQLGVLGANVDNGGQNGWSDGAQGYYAEDVDGVLKITFDRIAIPTEHSQTGVRADVFLSGTFEGDDSIHIYAEVEKTDGSTETIDLISVDADGMNNLKSVWRTFDSGLMGGVTAYTPVVEYSCNSGAEKMYLDYLLIYLPRE